MRKQYSCSYFKPVLWVDWSKEGELFGQVTKEMHGGSFQGFATLIMLFVEHRKMIVGK